MKSSLSILLFALPLTAVHAQDAQLVTFVTCPIYRDTDAGRKSGCWLAENPASGQRWDVTLSPYKPDFNYAVLVEGRVSEAKPDRCGSPVLDAVRTSRLYDVRCPGHMIPAESYPGREFRRQGRFINPISVARQVPDGPFSERTFTVYFEYNQDFLVYEYDDYLLDRAATWIAAAEPRKIIVTGYAATEEQTVSGYALAEDEKVAGSRANAVAVTLRRLIPGLAVETRVETASQPVDEPHADGLPGQSQRRAEIRAVF